MEEKIPALILCQIWEKTLFNSKCVSWLITHQNLSWHARVSHSCFVGDTESGHHGGSGLFPWRLSLPVQILRSQRGTGTKDFFDIFRYPWTSLDGSKKLHLATRWASAALSAPGQGQLLRTGNSLCPGVLIPFTRDTNPSGYSLLPLTVQQLYKPNSILNTQWDHRWSPKPHKFHNAGEC